MDLEKNGQKLVPIQGSYQITKSPEGLVTVRQFAIIETPTGPQVVGTSETQFTDPNVGKALAQFLVEAIKASMSPIVVPIGPTRVQ